MLVIKYYIFQNDLHLHCVSNNAQKMKFSIKDLFSKRDQIPKKLGIWSHLLKKLLLENFFFGGSETLNIYTNPANTPRAFHVETTGKRRFHVVSTSNTRGVFVGNLFLLLRFIYLYFGCIFLDFLL